LSPGIRRRRRNRHVVAVFGGLGNQLFQYCWATKIASDSGLPTYFDTSGLRSGTRRLELQNLGINIRDCELRLMRFMPFVGGRAQWAAYAVRKLLGPRRVVTEASGHALGDLHTPSWWYGYWQSRATVLDVLESVRRIVPTPVLAPSTVGMHVRRGDFVGLRLAASEEYYRRALSRLRAAYPTIKHVFIYSDDPGWCQQNLVFGIPTTIVVGRRPSEDLIALSGHEFMVLSRGTFGWWAAHLVEHNPDKIVVPMPYLPGSPDKESQLLDHAWQAIAES